MCAFAGLKTNYNIPIEHYREDYDSGKQCKKSEDYSYINTVFVYPWGSKKRNLFFIGPFELKDQKLPFGV